MRLRRLDLLRFGHFSGCSFELPAGERDFHIVFGPNEAGKSTALSAIEDLFFGIPPRSPYGFLHAYSSMRIGALLESGEELLEVVRRKGSKDTLLGRDDVPLHGGEAVLRPFLLGVDRSCFERMFSLDHVRLETGGREILEAQDEIGQILFSAGAGVAGLRDWLAEFQSEADGLWASRRAAHRRYYQAHDRLQDAERELRQHTLSASRWQELKRTLESAEDAYITIEREFEKVSAERTRLGRIRRVYRDVRRKADLEKAIAELGEVVSLPEKARQVLEESEREESEASTRIDTLSGQLTKVREELQSLNFDEKLVRRAEDIVDLHERRIEIRREKADLPKRQAELDAAEADLRAHAAELGWQEDAVEDLIARIPARVALNHVRSLLDRRGALVLGVDNGAAALEEAESGVARIQHQVDAFGEITDVSRLGAIIKTLRQSGDLSARMRTAEQQVGDAQGRVGRLLSALHPRVSNEKAVAEMKVPPKAQVQAHRDRVQDWARRIRETNEDIDKVEQDLERFRRDLRQIFSDEQPVGVETLGNAREDRDALWRLIKKKHIEKVPLSEEDAHRHADALMDLGTAFESAVQTADELADRRFDNAEAAARATELSRTIGRREGDSRQLDSVRERLDQESDRLNTDWQALWNDASLEPLDPDVMLEWLLRRDELLDSIERCSKAASGLKALRREEHAARESVLAELLALGVDRAAMDHDPLPVILERADRIRREHDSRAENKVRLDESLREAATQVERRRRELARAKQARSQWQTEWSTALAGLGFEAALSPDVVSARIEVIDQMREKARQTSDLRYQRIGKINRDIADFEAVVATMVGEVAEELADTSADEAVLEVEARLEEAQHTRDLRMRKERERGEIANEVRAIEEERQRARDSADHLREAAGVDTNDELRKAIETSDSLRTLQGQLDATLQTLREEGDGRTSADLERECDGVDVDELAAREESLDAALKDLRDRLAAAAEARSQARDAFQAAGGDDAAARAEARRQEALAEIRSVSERYVRVRSSALLMQWAIDRYRREKQAPLLRRAGRLFATITGASFESLRVDYDEKDRPYLTGLRPSGEVVRVSGMSNGTADQLYLALRIAAVEDYLDHGQALPFVADDLFINFDDDRAGAGLRVLGELSRKTQVLFFTHHSHLLGIARKALGDSVYAVNLNG